MLKKILSSICALLLISVVCSTIVVNAQQNEKIASLTLEDKIIANKPLVIDDILIQNEYKNAIPQDILSEKMKTIHLTNSSAKIDYSRSIVAKNQEENYLVKYYVTGDNLSEDSYIYFVLDESKKIKTSGAVYAFIDKNSLQGYVYTDSKLMMKITGDIEKDSYEGTVFDDNGSVKNVVNYDANESRRNLAGCLQSCVSEILGGWQTTIILAACVAACGATVGLGCAVCGTVLASYGVGFCWERCA